MSVIQVDAASCAAGPAGSVGADPVAARDDVTQATGALRYWGSVAWRSASPASPTTAPRWVHAAPRSLPFLSAVA